MPKTQISHTRPLPRRAVRLQFPALTRLLLPLVLVAAGVGLANGGQISSVDSVEATSGPAQVEVEVSTNGSDAPSFSVFPLREPDRLVMDLPGARWSRGLTTVLPAASPEVHQVRVGQFSENPPTTRVVFDLSVPARQVSYQTVASTGQGRLRVRVQDAVPGQGVTQAAGTPVIRATPDPVARPSAAPASPPPPAKPVAPDVAPAEDAEGAAATAQVEPLAATQDQPVGLPVGSQSAAARAPVGLHRGQAGSPVPSAGRLSRYALTGLVILLVWAAATWVRRRFHRDLGAVTQPVATPAVEPPGEADLLRCKVVDGYLVLAPEGGDPGGALLAPGARVEAKGDLIVTVTVGETSPVPPDDIAVTRLPLASAPTRGATLAAMTHDSDPAVRAAAIHALGQLGEAAAEYDEDVLDRVDDSDGAVRARAVEALAAIAPKSQQVARLMVQLIGDRDLSVRAAASASALSFAARGIMEPLVELLADLTRRSQALELLQLADEPTLRCLLSAARNAHPEVGEPAMETLSYVMSTPWTLEDFADELASPEAEVRMAGVEGLSIVGGPGATRELRRLLSRDPSPEVRARAAQVLAAWEDEAQAEGAGAVAGREAGPG